MLVRFFNNYLKFKIFILLISFQKFCLIGRTKSGLRPPLLLATRVCSARAVHLPGSVLLKLTSNKNDGLVITHIITASLINYNGPNYSSQRWYVLKIKHQNKTALEAVFEAKNKFFFTERWNCVGIYNFIIVGIYWEVNMIF